MSEHTTDFCVIRWSVTSKRTYGSVKKLIYSAKFRIGEDEWKPSEMD